MGRCCAVFIFLVFFSIVGAPFCNAANWPFPRDASYPFGIKPSHKPQGLLNQDVQTNFDFWRNTFLTQKGAPLGTWRVQRDLGFDQDTVSEGIGYGMLILVLMENPRNNTKAQFDGLLRYHRHFQNSRGLMHWRIDAKGSIVGENSATDAEQDVAMALLLAHWQWGSTGAVHYLNEAKQLMNRIMTYGVEKGKRFVLKPGDTWGGSEVTNPSYYAPSYWRIYRLVTKDARWSDVVVDSYGIINEITTRFSHGLLPDWCDAQGDPTGTMGYTFGYDAVRVPWRIGMDVLWNGPSASPYGKAMISVLNNWIIERSDANPAMIVDGYELDGDPIGEKGGPAFIGAFAVVAQAAGDQRWLNRIYVHLVDRLQDSSQQTYYDTSLGVLYLLTLTGNWPSLIPHSYTS